MSISTEIARIQQDKSKIKTKLIDLGLASSTSNLDDCASAIEGIENRGAVSAQITEGNTYTIPKGYHNGSGTVTGIGGGGSYSLQSKTVTPTKAQQNATPDDGYFGLSDVTVAAIPDVYQDVSAVTAGAADVLANKIIIDASGKHIAGTMVNNGAVAATIDGLNLMSYTIPEGYHNGKGTVGLANDIETALAAI